MLTNGVHATHWAVHADDLAWLDCWILRRGRSCPGDIADPARRVQLHFETTGSGDNPDQDRVNPPYVSRDYPLPETAWQRDYLVKRSSALDKAYHPSRNNWGPLIVPQKSYFVLGDNRAASCDSRAWGPLARGRVIGRTWLASSPYVLISGKRTRKPSPV